MAKKKRGRKPNPKPWKPTDAAFPEKAAPEPKPKLMRFKVIHPFKDKNGVHHGRGYIEMPYEEARVYVRRRQLMLSKQPEVQDA
jgi:hypothetical protein